MLGAAGRESTLSDRPVLHIMMLPALGSASLSADGMDKPRGSFLNSCCPPPAPLCVHHEVKIADGLP